MAQSSASFRQYFPCTWQILTASSEGLNSPGTGICSFSNGNQTVEFSQTLHCPDLASNLMSVPRLAQHGYVTVFDSAAAYVLQAHACVLWMSQVQTSSLLTAPLKDGLYSFTPNSPPQSAALHVSAATGTTGSVILIFVILVAWRIWQTAFHARMLKNWRIAKPV